MIKLTAVALVDYVCVLTEQDEKKVLDYANENNMTIKKAIKILWEEFEIDIYAGDVTDSDCSTQEIRDVEIEEE